MEYSAESAAAIHSQMVALNKPKAELDIDLHELADRLTVLRAKSFLRQGVMRRLNVANRCVQNIFQIFPPGRNAALDKEELDDVTINLHAFVINVYGILDNVAWVCVLEGGFKDPDTNRVGIGLYKAATKPYLPVNLVRYLNNATMQTWFNEYARVYRDSTAHRIPPYIPPKRMTPEEAKQFLTLDSASWDALLNQHDVDVFERIKSQQNGLGCATATMTLSLTGDDFSPPIWLHHQLICDSLTIHELLRKFSVELRAMYGFPPALILPLNL